MAAADLTSLINRISLEINRGDRYDAEIPDYLSDAVRFLEMNNDFVYMEATEDQTLAKDARDVTILGHVVDVELFRLIRDDGALHYLHKVDPDDVTGVDTALPNGFYIRSHSTTETVLRMDNRMDQEYEAELRVRRYSPAVLTGDEYIILAGAGLLLAETVIQMAARHRNFDLVQAKERIHPRLLTAFLSADARLRHESKHGSMVAYAEERPDV